MKGVRGYSKKLFDVYFRHYKKLMVVPFALLILMLSVLGFNYMSTGEFIQRDITLKGGTAITMYTELDLPIETVDSVVRETFGTEDVIVRKLTDATQTVVLGYDVQVDVEVAKTQVLNELAPALGLVLDDEDVSVAVQSSEIAATFFRDVIIVLGVAFILMSFVVLYYFRNIIPAASIILSTVSDVVCILGGMALLGVKFSISSIGGLLMIIGYSTNSDILLATYILKRREGSLKDRMKQAIRIELTTDLAAYVVYLVMFFLSNVEIIKHIALILLLGTTFDMVNTWIQNAGLQRLYLEWRKRR